MKLEVLPISFVGRTFLKASKLSSLLCGLLLLFGPASWAAVAIHPELVVSGLSNPVGITNAGDGSGRLFIVLQGGRFVIFDGMQVLSSPFLDISSLVSFGGERGLLGLAFHPDYAENGQFFIHYDDQNGTTQN